MSHSLSKKLIFWGAGATAELGIRVTVHQGRFIQSLAGTYAETFPPLKERIDRALGSGVDAGSLHSALFELITILGDRPENYKNIDAINDDEHEAMRRSWEGDDGEIKSRIVNLRLFYDWPALKSLVRICPGSSGDSFKLNDLFNLLDMHGPSGFGVRAQTGHMAAGQFFDARRLAGAANALKMLLGALFYIDYQNCLRNKPHILEQYKDFATCLGRRVLRQGEDLANTGKELDTPGFYQADVAFVSLNYDPIALWVQFLANRDLNKKRNVFLGPDEIPLQLFHDSGHLIPSRRIEGNAADWPWYPMNEASAQRMNEAGSGSSKVRLTKFLFPHGCLCWRECPDCGKLSSYYGDEWSLQSAGLFLPPPLKAFEAEDCPDRIRGPERKQRERGAIDARACLHCGTLTFAHNTQMVMQSSFKAQPPSFIEEIQRDLRAVAMKADHVIFMGYSLPPDDVTYRAFFSARCQRHKTGGDPVHCTVVGKNNKYPNWYEPALLSQELVDNNSAVKAAIDIFGRNNVRFFGGGVPDVFLEAGVVSEAAIERLLNWPCAAPAKCPT